MPEKGFPPLSFLPSPWMPKNLQLIFSGVSIAVIVVYGCALLDGVGLGLLSRETVLGLSFTSYLTRSNDATMSTTTFASLGERPNAGRLRFDVTASSQKPVRSEQTPPSVSDGSPSSGLSSSSEKNQQTQYGKSAASPAQEARTTSGAIPSPFPNSSGIAAEEVDWISVALEQNFTSNLLARWLTPGGKRCSDSLTTSITIPELDGRDSVVLSTGRIHEFVVHTYGEDRTPRCLGGDYFETDLSGGRWKSRPPIEDHGNGSYTISLQVHPDFDGVYNLSVVLLFRNYQGLKYSPIRFSYRKELRNILIKFRRSSGAQLPEIRECNRSDFSREIWSGRWTRQGGNDSCEIDDDGRYRCLDAAYACDGRWCRGPLGSVESNGWVYSAHCSFKIFTGDEAWNCLTGKWVFFWGDSNHVDTIRNILNFLLYHPEIEAVPRRFDRNFTHPRSASQTVRITSIFNGHWNDTMNYEGLNSLRNDGFRELLKGYFSGETVPDVMIMNSGLHDGVRWSSLRRYVNGADYAASFWDEVLKSVAARGRRRPRFVYRTTVATGGYARDLAFNPSKMEAFNLVMLERLRERGVLDGVVDDFDLTFPWHFDNRCNDGVHYGRGPAKQPWKDGLIGHQYFVDLMLAHILLNAICPA